MVIKSWKVQYSWFWSRVRNEILQSIVYLLYCSDSLEDENHRYNIKWYYCLSTWVSKFILSSLVFRHYLVQCRTQEYYQDGGGGGGGDNGGGVQNVLHIRLTSKKIKGLNKGWQPFFSSFFLPSPPPPPPPNTTHGTTLMFAVTAWDLKTLFNIVEERLKKKLNFESPYSGSP